MTGETSKETVAPAAPALGGAAPTAIVPTASYSGSLVPASRDFVEGKVELIDYKLTAIEKKLDTHLGAHSDATSRRWSAFWDVVKIVLAALLGALLTILVNALGLVRFPRP